MDGKTTWVRLAHVFLARLVTSRTCSYEASSAKLLVLQGLGLLHCVVSCHRSSSGARVSSEENRSTCRWKGKKLRKKLPCWNVSFQNVSFDRRISHAEGCEGEVMKRGREHHKTGMHPPSHARAVSCAWLTTTSTGTRHLAVDFEGLLQ